MLASGRNSLPPTISSGQALQKTQKRDLINNSNIKQPKGIIFDNDSKVEHRFQPQRFLQYLQKIKNERTKREQAPRSKKLPTVLSAEEVAY